MNLRKEEDRKFHSNNYLSDLGVHSMTFALNLAAPIVARIGVEVINSYVEKNQNTQEKLYLQAKLWYHPMCASKWLVIFSSAYYGIDLLYSYANQYFANDDNTKKSHGVTYAVVGVALASLGSLLGLYMMLKNEGMFPAVGEFKYNNELVRFKAIKNIGNNLIETLELLWVYKEEHSWVICKEKTQNNILFSVIDAATGSASCTHKDIAKDEDFDFMGGDQPHHLKFYQTNNQWHEL
jgi:hypothetical protein